VRLKRIVRFVLSCDALGVRSVSPRQFFAVPLTADTFLRPRSSLASDGWETRAKDAMSSRAETAPATVATQPLLPSSPSVHVCPRTQMRDALWGSVTGASPFPIALVFSAVSWRRIRGRAKGALIVLPLTISTTRFESPSRMRMRDWFRGGQHYCCAFEAGQCIAINRKARGVHDAPDLWKEAKRCRIPFPFIIICFRATTASFGPRLHVRSTA
jgi:hypothetical protein